MGAVVEVSLEPAAFAIGGVDDPRARCSKLLQLSERLGLQPFVLESEPDGGPELGLQFGTVAGVNNHGDRAPCYGSGA